LPAEIRSLKFSTEELRTIISNFLSRRGKVTQHYEIDRISFEQKPDGVEANVCLIREISRGKETVIIPPEDLLAAALLYCVIHRIPMATKAKKRVTLHDDTLTLVMTLLLPRGETEQRRAQAL
jgi:hypothetical protein